MFTDYKVGENFISALLNNDYSGLDENDKNCLDEFKRVEQVIETVCVCEGLCFDRCDISGLLNNCYRVTIKTK